MADPFWHERKMLGLENRTYIYEMKVFYDICLYCSDLSIFDWNIFTYREQQPHVSRGEEQVFLLFGEGKTPIAVGHWG